MPTIKVIASIKIDIHSGGTSPASFYVTSAEYEDLLK